jgi:hypothetical protein
MSQGEQIELKGILLVLEQLFMNGMRDERSGFARKTEVTDV